MRKRSNKKNEKQNATSWRKEKHQLTKLHEAEKIDLVRSRGGYYKDKIRFDNVEEGIY